MFNYDNFSKKICADPEKEERIKKYEEKYGIGKGSIIEDHPFYTNYLSKFNTCFELITPDDVVMGPQEWDLLARLVYGSFSSSYSFILDEEWKRNPTDKIRVHLCISTNDNQGKHASKRLDELFSLQVERLFEIYVNEQIELLTLHDKEEEEWDWPFCDYDDEFPIKEHREEKIAFFEKTKKYLISEAESYIKLQQLIHL